MKKKGFFGNKPVLITVMAVVVLLVLSLITSGDRTVSWFESAIGTVTTPIQTLARTVSNSIVSGVRDLFNTTDADKENEQLKAKVAELEVAVSSYEEMRLENERLKELVNYAGTIENMEYVTATVIANSNTVWFDMFTLNAGRSSGIEPGCPVVTGDGLVGVVTDVGSTWCKVRSVIDSQSSIGVLVERTRDNGFIRGTLTTGSGSDELELYFLPSGSDLIPGDVIVTNGLGSSQIPKGIAVGTVSEVMRVTGVGSDETNATVIPAVDFLHLEDVIVITKTGE